MDWKSRRIEAILEQALVEDKATSDVTTAITIDPSLLASATMIAKQDCVISGLGCIPRFLEIFARLDQRNSGRYEVVSHPEIFEGVRVKKGQAIAVIRHNARVILALRARHSEPDAANERHRHTDAAICGRDLGHKHAKFSIRARPFPGCAFSTSTRCAAAAARITASIFPMAF